MSGYKSNGSELGQSHGEGGRETQEQLFQKALERADDLIEAEMTQLVAQLEEAGVRDREGLQWYVTRDEQRFDNLVKDLGGIEHVDLSLGTLLSKSAAMVLLNVGYNSGDSAEVKRMHDEIQQRILTDLTEVFVARQQREHDEDQQVEHAVNDAVNGE